MTSSRSNFFCTRSVPCELWFFNRAKPKDRRDQVLMLDARNIYRKVTRKINDFSPEQMQNLSAIIWLYRGQRDRFLALVKEYLGFVCTESAAISDKLAALDVTLQSLREHFVSLKDAVVKLCSLDPEKKNSLTEAVTELDEAIKPYENDRVRLLADLDDFRKQFGQNPTTNEKQHAARKAFDPIADHMKDLVRQVDLLYKLAARIADSGHEVASDEALASAYDRRSAGRLMKQLNEERKAAVEQLKQTTYFDRQIVWMQDRFPKAELEAVPGLVKLVDRKEIEAADWSLTPGRYVGVAPPEEDEDFDFEGMLRDIHTELADLDKEAVELASKIQTNFEELGI